MARGWPAGVVLIAVLLGAQPARADDWWGTDKALHLGLSAGIAGAGYAGGALLFEERWARVVTGATLAVTAGATKELIDLTGAGDPSWKDFAWDLVGAAIGVGIALAIDYAVTGGRIVRARTSGATLMRFQ